MKLNKFFLGLLGGVAIMAASCSSDDDYKGASVSGAQVYFSDALPTQYEISPDANSCNDVVISRVDDSQEMTVSLAAEQEEGSIYSIPSSVTFEAGKKEVAVPISYDPAQIEFGKYETITIKIGSETTSWGISEYTFRIGVTDWGEWKPWNETGTADYYYAGILFDGEDPDLPFSYRQSVINTNLYQFKLEHWGYDVDLIWDYDASTGIVSFEHTFTGLTHSTYGDEFISDYKYYITEIQGDDDPGVYGYFDEEQGILACPVVYYDADGAWGVDYEYIYIDGYARADYSSELTYSGIYTNADNEIFAIASLTLGADATGAKAVVVDAKQNASEVAAAIAAGEIEATDVEAGRIEVPIAAGMTGKLQIVAVVIEDGEIKSVASVNFKYEGANSETWSLVGTGDYTYTLFFGAEDDPYVAEGMELYRSDNDPTSFKIEHWGYDVDFAFTMDESGKILVDDQETGYVHSQYGAVYVDDLVDYTEGEDFGISYYDEETNTFNFAIVYYIGAGEIGYGYETFTLNASTETKARSSKEAKKPTPAVNKPHKKIRSGMMKINLKENPVRGK